jgi:hypothetical protein
MNIESPRALDDVALKGIELHARKLARTLRAQKPAHLDGNRQEKNVHRRQASSISQRSTLFSRRLTCAPGYLTPL